MQTTIKSEMDFTVTDSSNDTTSRLRDDALNGVASFPVWRFAEMWVKEGRHTAVKVIKAELFPSSVKATCAVAYLFIG